MLNELTAILRFVLLIAPLLLFYLVIRDSLKRKGKFAVSVKAIHCPLCNTRLPRFRIPKSVQQVRAGTWTCPTCKAEVNYRGEIVSQPPP